MSTRGRCRSPVWDHLDDLHAMHAERRSLGEQSEFLGVSVGTIQNARHAVGLRYHQSERGGQNLPATPILRLIASRSLSYASERAMLLSVAAERGVSYDALQRAVNRAKSTGRVTERTAERLAIYLGRRVEDLWEERETA
jgi:hypothetical protein